MKLTVLIQRGNPRPGEILEVVGMSKEIEAAWRAYVRAETKWCNLRRQYCDQGDKVHKWWLTYQFLRHPVEPPEKNGPTE